MPSTLQQKIKRALQREPRFHNGVYEKRATIDGIQIYACSSRLEDCERIFLGEISAQFVHELSSRTKRLGRPFSERMKAP